MGYYEQIEGLGMSVKAYRIGAHESGWTDFVAEQLPTASPAPNSEAIQTAIIEALNAPLGFPPLEQTLTLDDLVAIAIGPGTPAKNALATGVVTALEQAGVTRDRITVVVASTKDAESLDLPRIKVEVHDPTDDDMLCFTGLTKHDRKLMLNRSLFDADVLLPITTLGPRDGLNEGPFFGVYPDFCDQPAIDRFRRVRSVVAALAREGDHAAVRRREVEEAGWMFGAPLVVGVVPGSSGKVSEVVAGDPTSVGERLQSAFQETWSKSVSEPANLVVATLGGDSTEHTWSAIGRALETTERLASPGGVVVLWTDLDEPIGPALSQLLDAEDFDRLIPTLSEEAGEEALAAWRLMQALERGPVFFKGRLPAPTIERLGMAPVADTDELNRLVQRHGSCVLLEEAQHVWIQS